MESRLLFISFAVSTLIACSPATEPGDTRVGGGATQQLHELFADEWDDRLSRDPLFASSMGIDDYDDRLPDASPAAG